MAKKMSQQEYNRRKEMLNKGYGWCSKCKEFKPVETFSKNKSNMFGLHLWCKECHSKYRKADDNTKRKARQRSRQFTAYYVALAGGCCQRCGYSKSQCALDFHHVIPETKEYLPSLLVNQGRSHEDVVTELDKCVLLCANCHREYTASLWAAEFTKRDGLGWSIKKGSIVETNAEAALILPDKYQYVQPGLL